MSKKSLLISDSERYGPKSPAVLTGDGKEEDRKTAPTIELSGKQVDAFCACELKPGETGTATVHYTVKAVKMGEEYGNDVPGKNTTKRVTLSLTHVESDKEDGGEEEEGSDAEEEGETAEEETAEGEGDELAAPATEAPATKKKSVSPKDAALDD